jgi:hypothetical protein
LRYSIKKKVAFAALTIAASIATPFAGSAMAAEPGTPPTGPSTVTPTTGDGTDVFTLDAVGGNPADPTNSYCPGDSANDGYRWQTYITPAAVDPATLTYNADGPVVPAAQSALQAQTWPLLSAAGSFYVNRNTSVNPKGFFDGADAPFSFSQFPTDLFPSGDYIIGLACTKAQITESYWEVPVTITATGTGYTIAPTGPGPVIPEAPLTVLLPLTGLAAVGGFLVLRRRNAAASLAA